MTAPSLGDPDTFADGPPHDLLTELRCTKKVAWQDMPGTKNDGFFAVLTHHGVVEVARHSEIYSANSQGVVLEDLPEESLAMMRHMLLAMDPPDHSIHRRPLADSFKAKVIANLEPQIRGICRGLMVDIKEKQRVDFVTEVAAAVPSQVMGHIMGLPEKDWAHLHELAQRQTASQDRDINTDDNGGTQSASVEMAIYAINFAAQRRLEPPREDITTLILDADFGGQQMSDLDFGSFFVQLVTAGNDTTKTMLSSGLLTLLEHPDQLRQLREDRSRIPDAVEEILRFANPLHYFRRTTTQDTTLDGVEIPEGSKVAMYYTSANRDEAVFDDPQSFNIARSPNRHLAFGIAEHFCLGVHLARLEGRIFFEELLDAFTDIRLTGDPIRIRSNLNNGFRSMPVQLLAHA